MSNKYSFDQTIIPAGVIAVRQLSGTDSCLTGLLFVPSKLLQPRHPSSVSLCVWVRTSWLNLLNNRRGPFMLVLQKQIILTIFWHGDNPKCQYDCETPKGPFADMDSLTIYTAARSKVCVPEWLFIDLHTHVVWLVLELYQRSFFQGHTEWGTLWNFTSLTTLPVTLSLMIIQEAQTFEMLI